MNIATLLHCHIATLPQQKYLNILDVRIINAKSSMEFARRSCNYIDYTCTYNQNILYRVYMLISIVLQLRHRQYLYMGPCVTAGLRDGIEGGADLSIEQQHYPVCRTKPHIIYVFVIHDHLTAKSVNQLSKVLQAKCTW